jgi:DNA helicase-2/ATP-dependent DNA helicase PcrA
MQDFFSGLNPAQQKAVRTVDGPLLIVAGAGTGKTRTLVYRLAYMAACAGIDPAQLLAITFTARAAEEMHSRLAAMQVQGIGLSAIRVSTIHALCYDILKQHGAHIGLPADVCLITPADRAALIKEAAAACGQDGTRSRKRLELEITREKNGPDGYGGLSPVSLVYQELLEARGLLDFDDLILKTAKLFAAAPQAREAVCSRFSHISIDEYQDVNAAQYACIKALCPQQPNLCAVGDADQAIYGFRGAQVDIFLRFQTDFPGAAVLHLEDNYRSSATILAAAQSVIEQNSLRIDKTLRPQRPRGAPVEILELPTDLDEAAFVSREVERLMGGMRFESLGHEADECVKGFGDIAVLYRLHQQGRLLKKALQSRGIPVDIAATKSVFEEPAIQTVLKMLEGIAGIPGEGALPVMPAEILPARQGLPVPADRIEQCSRRADELDLDRLIAEIWDGLFGAAEEKSDDYFAFLTASMAFSGMPARQGIPLFLQKIALLHDGEICTPRREAVTLMTVHSSKGLEFPVVFITGLEQGLFPYVPDSTARIACDNEEERRLFYVGMTRARDRLYVLNARSRFFFGERRQMTPSCFIGDMPAEHCRRQSRQAPKKSKKKQLKLFV